MIFNLFVLLSHVDHAEVAKLLMAAGAMVTANGQVTGDAHYVRNDFTNYHLEQNILLRIDDSECITAMI